MTRKERVAIARIISDMIKADNIIEESEIEMLNQLKDIYNIDSHILSEARQIMFSTAVSDLENLSNKEKIDFFNSIRSMAVSDGVCVPREAMLLLALRYAFGIVRDREDRNRFIINPKTQAKLISCPTGDASLTSQYVIYIEGKYYEHTNSNIKDKFEFNVLKLRQWGFDLIYIPSLIEEFKVMNASYVKNVVSYMAPELSEETIDVVYNRLLKMDTMTFCNYVLADKLQVGSIKNAEPSLLVNIGTSIGPNCSSNGHVQCYTEFLCLPITDDITTQINDFVGAYSKLVSFYAAVNPTNAMDTPNRFKYFGFYKAMFDFLVKAEPKESYMVIHPLNSSIEFPQVDVGVLKLSPQEGAFYKLVLECTFNQPFRFCNYATKHQKELESLYRKIYRKKDAPFPDQLAPIRTRIEKKMRKVLKDLANLEDYIPKLQDGQYVITANPENIKISGSRFEEEQSFQGYKWK